MSRREPFVVPGERHRSGPAPMSPIDCSARGCPGPGLADRRPTAPCSLDPGGNPVSQAEGSLLDSSGNLLSFEVSFGAFDVGTVCPATTATGTTYGFLDGVAMGTVGTSLTVNIAY